MSEVPSPFVVDADTLTGEMHPIRRAVFSIGSNLGDRTANLQGALNTLADTPEVWITAVSPVYETEPVDSPAEADDYLNIIVLADTTMSAKTMLERALAIEDAYGRERGSIFHAPRTLDIDLIVLGDRLSNDEHLTLPHPEAHKRAFVLAPWFDVEPDASIPGVGAVAELLETVGRDGVTRRDDVELDLL